VACEGCGVSRVGRRAINDHRAVCRLLKLDGIVECKHCHAQMPQKNYELHWFYCAGRNARVDR